MNPILFYEAGKRKAIPQDYILRYDFNGDYLDKSINGLNGVKTGAANFTTGRKAGTQCLQFINGCVRTPSNLPINSDKLTVSFWINTSQVTAGAIVMEMGVTAPTNANRLFDILLNNDNAGSLMGRAGTLIPSVITNFKDSWKHIVFTFNRALSDNEINGFLNNVFISSSAGTLTNTFINDILFIGQRNAASSQFEGNLQDIRIYNRVLSASEIKNLFNE